MNINLNEKQLNFLEQESKFIRSNGRVKFIELYINIKTLSLVWLQKGISYDRYIKEKTFNTINDKDFCFIGAIVKPTTSDKIRQYIYNQLFKRNIRNINDFFGAVDVRTVNYNEYDINSFRYN